VDAARSEQPTDGIGADAPILTASEDRLGRANYVGRIVSELSSSNSRDGKVFAIRGGWGFGKSSLKNLIIKRLNDAKNKSANWLDFNPWQWGDSDAIARALFFQIADRLGGKYSKKELARAEALRRYGEIFTGASKPLKKAGSSDHFISTLLANASVVAVASAIGFNLSTLAKAWSVVAAIVAAVLAVLSAGAFLLGRALSFFGRDHSGEPLDKVRETLKARLSELDQPLVIFVDDIDRLEPNQIIALLRQVKANANLPNIVFVLLFQPSIVEQALNPIAAGNGHAFLEKIVQANFDLPKVPVSTVHSVFGDELSQRVEHYATETNGFLPMRWMQASKCIQSSLHNIRDVRRLISSIAIYMPLHVNGSVFEVNIIDFLLLEVLRVFEPDLHDALFGEKDLLAQERLPSDKAQQDRNKKAAAKLLELVPEERRDIPKNVLKELFPLLEWAYGDRDSLRHSSRWLDEKRVCTSRYFPRYFELQTTEGEISERRFVDFLGATATEENLTAAIAAIEADGLLPSLAARLDESVDRLPPENAAVLLPGMFEIAQKFVGMSNDQFSNFPYISACRAASYFLKRVPKDKRGDLVLDALRKTKALSVASMLIHLKDPFENKDGTFDPALDLNTVKAMKAEWLRLIRDRAANGDALIAEPDIVSLLYWWKDYAGSPSEPREWVTKMIRTDPGFANMATGLMRRGTSYDDGVSKPFNCFDKETIDGFIGIDVAKARCDAIDPARFPEHKEALQTLKLDLDTWIHEKPSPTA